MLCPVNFSISECFNTSLSHLDSVPVVTALCCFWQLINNCVLPPRRPFCSLKVFLQNFDKAEFFIRSA